MSCSGAQRLATGPTYQELSSLETTFWLEVVEKNRVIYLDVL